MATVVLAAGATTEVEEAVEEDVERVAGATPEPVVSVDAVRQEVMGWEASMAGVVTVATTVMAMAVPVAQAAAMAKEVA